MSTQNRNLLFLHPVFPGQLTHLIRHYAADPKYTVVHLSRESALPKPIPGVKEVHYHRQAPKAFDVPPAMKRMEDGLWEGQAVLAKLAQLKAEGFVPDVMIGYAGWGATTFLKDFYPNVPFIGYFEWYLNATGHEYDFDPAFPITFENQNCLHLQNANTLLDLVNCDAGITPTQWQKQAFPQAFHNKLHVIHDGVDTAFYQPQPNAKLVLPEKQIDLSGVSEIVTYATRGMEPYRGFPQFIRAAEYLLNARPQCHVVISGTDGVHYSKRPDGTGSYKDQLMANFQGDRDRIHFTGWLSLQQYRTVIQASSAHVYLTYPYVLSWSLLEAMACGAFIVASNTAPVQEVIIHQQNGLLVDFFDSQALGQTLCEILDNPAHYRHLKQAARHTIETQYSLSACLPQHQALIESLL